jgi:hypothetical protein
LLCFTTPCATLVPRLWILNRLSVGAIFWSGLGGYLITDLERTLRFSAGTLTIPPGLESRCM